MPRPAVTAKAPTQSATPDSLGATKSVRHQCGLPAGRYVVKSFADENGNAKLDTNLLGLPTERYGFSNDARGRMGPPGFDAAAVPLDADHSITIRLR